MRGVAFAIGGVAMLLLVVAAFLGAKQLAASRGWPRWLVFLAFMLIFVAGAGVSVAARWYRRATSTPPSAGAAMPSPSPN